MNFTGTYCNIGCLMFFINDSRALRDTEEEIKGKDKRKRRRHS